MTIEEAKLISEFDARKFVEEHYAPVEGMPGYVWLTRRHKQIISIDVLAASMEETLRINYKAESEEEE